VRISPCGHGFGGRSRVAQRRLKINRRVNGLVSIIVPCFQQEQFIAEALGSIQAQTYPNWECIVVDDGSTDSSRRIIQGFAARDERIRYIYQENSGVSAARNHGFSQARGEFINFLDGDDLLRSEKLRRQVEYLNANPDVVWCYCDHVHRFEAKGIEEHYEAHPLRPDPLEDFLFHWDRGLSVPLHCGLFRRSIWGAGELPFAPDYGGRWEDWLFWIDLCLRGGRFSFIPECNAVYRIHSSNFSAGVQVGTEHAIRAAFYVAPRLPETYRDRFLSETISYHLERYASKRIVEEVRQSLLFRGLKHISKPLNVLISGAVRAKIKKYLFGSYEK